MEDLEIRTYPLELRKSKDGKLEGYASIFDSWSDLWGYKEVVRRGAFTKTLKEGDVRALFNHDSNYVLGRNKADTLELNEDAKGLHIRVTPPDTSWAKDLLVSVERGDINQMSFGFRTIKERWFTEDDENKRELLEVSLDNGDVSIVTYPAYEKTEVFVRSAWAPLMVRMAKNIDLTEKDKEMLREKLDEPGELDKTHSDDKPQAGYKVHLGLKEVDLAEKT